MGYIYKITNTVNNKAYIGQTKQADPNTRWKQHIRAINAKNGCPILYAAFKKYGVDKFKFEVIIECLNEDVCKFEKEYVQKYNTLAPNGYNAVDGGEPGGMFKGKHHSDESKKIIGEKSTEYYKDPENRRANGEKISAALKTSEKWKKSVEEKRIKQFGKGVPKSDETKKKISESMKKVYSNNEDMHKNRKEIMTRIRGRVIKQFDMSQNFIKEYPSIAEGAIQSGVNPRNIQANTSGYTKSAGGFIWKYADITQEKVSKEVLT